MTMLVYCLLAHTSENVKIREWILIGCDPTSDGVVVAHYCLRFLFVYAREQYTYPLYTTGFSFGINPIISNTHAVALISP